MLCSVSSMIGQHWLLVIPDSKQHYYCGHKWLWMIMMSISSHLRMDDFQYCTPDFVIFTTDSDGNYKPHELRAFLWHTLSPFIDWTIFYTEKCQTTQRTFCIGQVVTCITVFPEYIKKKKRGKGKSAYKWDIIGLYCWNQNAFENNNTVSTE